MGRSWHAVGPSVTQSCSYMHQGCSSAPAAALITAEALIMCNSQDYKGQPDLLED